MKYKVIKGYKDKDTQALRMPGDIIEIETKTRASQLVSNGFIKEYEGKEGGRERGKPNYKEEDFEPKNARSLYDKSLDQKESKGASKEKDADNSESAQTSTSDGVTIKKENASDLSDTNNTLSEEDHNDSNNKSSDAETKVLEDDQDKTDSENISGRDQKQKEEKGNIKTKEEKSSHKSK